MESLGSGEWSSVVKRRGRRPENEEEEEEDAESEQEEEGSTGREARKEAMFQQVLEVAGRRSTAMLALRVDHNQIGRAHV